MSLHEELFLSLIVTQFIHEFSSLTFIRKILKNPIMSTAPVEDAQPEQTVTSSTQDETMKSEEEAPATKVEDAAVKPESKDTEKKEKNGIRTYEDGVLKTTAQEDLKDRRKNSKYDPSILPETDDAQLIRNQVCF
jgi:lupus La protein